MKKKIIVSSGSNTSSTLLTVFIILKLTKLISWSWFWVLSPLWITLGIAVLFWILVIIVNVIKK